MIVVLVLGEAKPELRSALRMRSMLYLTAESGRPTSVGAPNPCPVTSTTTSQGMTTIPAKAIL